VPDVITRLRVLPVVVLEDAHVAGDLAAALVAGGLPIAEVTFRTAAAEAGIRAMSADPGMLVGAGTVLRPEQVDQAAEAGARFVVSPGFSAGVVARARRLGLPVFPGVGTATEIMAAIDAGIETVKLFPAESSGGVAALRALSAPFPGLAFIPTGGITRASMASYLGNPAVVAVGGSWMVAAPLLRDRRFGEVTRLAADAVLTAADASVR
jgi:2-dehydro-3-deoxyphosphogluconate aldolase/(4S)-4-hydroxy-2-oxoglutarate aldolase